MKKYVYDRKCFLEKQLDKCKIYKNHKFYQLFEKTITEKISLSEYIQLQRKS